MHLHLLITTTFVWLVILPLGYSILTREPADVVTQLGSNVEFICYTNLSKPVMWEQEKAGGESPQWLTVYQGDPGEIQPRFKPRYNVLVDFKLNQYNLTIADIQLQDVGTFRCGDDLGLALRHYLNGIPGNGATAELVAVIDNQLKCEQNIDDHQFLQGHVSTTDLRPDWISINCSLYYRGNVSPTLEWSLILDPKSNKENMISLGEYAEERVMSNFDGNFTLFSAIKLLPGGVLHNSRVRCKVAGPVNSKSAIDDLKAVVNVNLSWTSKEIQVLCSSDTLCSSSAQTSPATTVSIVANGVLLIILLVLIIYVRFLRRRVNRPTQNNVTPENENFLPKDQAKATTTHDINQKQLNGVREKYFVAIGKNEDGQILMMMEWKWINPMVTNTLEGIPAEVHAGSAICFVNKVLYAVGIGEGFNELWKWSANRMEWTRCADMPSGRRKHNVTSLVDNKIYVLGGWSETNQKSLESVLCYDINSDTWNEVGYLKKAVHDAACTTFGTLIFVFGGCDSGRPLKDVQIYDTLSNSSSMDDNNQMPERYSLMRAVTVDNQAILIGQHACYLYNFDSKEWQERERFQTNLEHFDLTLINNILYMSSSMSTACETASEMSNNEENRELKQLSVDDFKTKNEEARWRYYATLPATVQVLCSTPLYVS